MRACSRNCHKRTLRTTFGSCYRMNSCWRRGREAVPRGEGAAIKRDGEDGATGHPTQTLFKSERGRPDRNASDLKRSSLPQRP